MKRDIHFIDPAAPLSYALGLSEARCQEFERVIGQMYDRNASLEQIIAAVNEEGVLGELTDAEWTAFIYALGFLQCRCEMFRRMFPVPKMVPVILI